MSGHFASSLNGWVGGDFAKVSKKLKGGILLFVVLGDFGFDVTCQACPENSLIALGSQPPLVTRIARTGLGMRLVLIKHWLGQLDYKIGSSKVVVVFTEYSGRFWVGLCCPILQIWTPFQSDFALKIINLVLDNICGYIDLSCVPNIDQKPQQGWVAHPHHKYPVESSSRSRVQ